MGGSLLSIIVFLKFFIEFVNGFYLLFLYMIFVLLISIFLISGGLSLSVPLLCFVITCCFMVFKSEVVGKTIYIYKHMSQNKTIHIA